nr:hypothetical protein Iba_chr09aCG13850 [Ipomoea batatas]
MVTHSFLCFVIQFLLGEEYLAVCEMVSCLAVMVGRFYSVLCSDRRKNWRLPGDLACVPISGVEVFLGVLGFPAMMQACLLVAGVLYCALPEKRRPAWFRVFSLAFMVVGVRLISLLAC